MIDFAYTARSSSGEAADGIITADDAAHAREQLRAEGLFPMSVTSKSSPVVQKKRRPKSGGKIRQVDLLMVTSQLSIMSRSGVDLADSLKGVSEECVNPALQTTLDKVYEDVAAGETVSTALSRHTDVFGETYVVAIQAAEASGKPGSPYYALWLE